MKSIVIAAFAACFAMPAMAQGWGGVATTPTSIPGLPDFTHIDLTGNRASKIGQLSPTCSDYFKPGAALYIDQVSAGHCSAEALARGAEFNYTSLAFDASGHPFYDSNGTLANNVSLVTSIPAAALSPGSLVSVAVYGGYADPSSPGGVSYFDGLIPLSAFTASAALQEQLKVQQYQIESSQRGIAMASSLSLIAPMGDANNRLALGFGTFNNFNAVSVNYIRRVRNYDIGAAASFSGGDALGKASFGISW